MNNEKTNVKTHDAINQPENYEVILSEHANNKVNLVGTLVGPFTYDYEVMGERFFKTFIRLMRKSEEEDIIPIIVSERLIPDLIEKDLTDQWVKINGNYRSFNQITETKSKLLLSVFVRVFEIISEDGVVYDLLSCTENNVQLNGYLCKAPVYRKTPLGREITDILLAVNRPYGKTDYIPCVCWGRNARYVAKMAVGTQFALGGRIQSREYKKKINETEFEPRIAYEVSVSNIRIVA